MRNKKTKGITLIALVITIIVLLILAGVTIATLTGDNGAITKAVEAKFKTELSEAKEEYELYVTSKYSEDSNFEEGTLNAGKGFLIYNTMPAGETGNIYTILKSTPKKYAECFEVIRGELIYSNQDAKQLEWALEIGLKINPYLIVEGELLSSDTNLMLMDKETGTVVLPESVTKIGEGTFAKANVRRLIIPSTVKEISKNAFNGNKTLEEVIFQTNMVNGKEEGVEKIGDNAFCGCGNLKTMEMPDTLTTLGREVFWGCYSLNNVILSKNLTTIPYHTFAYCASITEIVIPEKVKSLDSHAMRNCDNLRSVTISKTLESISSTTFLLCKNLTTINTSENENFKFKNGILFNKDETEMIFITYSTATGNTFVVPNGITKLPTGLLDAFNNITTIKIPASVLNIEPLFVQSTIQKIEIDENNPNYCSTGEAIYNKDKTIIYRYLNTVSNVNVPEGVKSIGRYAFYGCGNITDIMLPDSLTSIDWEAFAYMGKLKSIHIGKNLETLDPMAFWRSKNITNFTIDEANSFYETDGKTIYNKGRTRIVTILPLVENYTIPAGVTRVGPCAFYTQNITNIIIPEGVETIR